MIEIKDFEFNCAPMITCKNCKYAPLVTCKNCKHRTEHHYEKDGEQPYVKLTCGNKYGLNNEYQIHDYDYCSRFEAREGTAWQTKYTTI